MMNNTIFYPDQLISLIETHGSKMSFHKGVYIYHPGDETTYIYTIKKGQVFISRMQPEGVELATNLISEKGIFGAVTLFCGPKVHATYAKAKVNTEIYKISRKRFETLILENEDIKTEWMHWVEIDRQRSITKMRDNIMYGKIGALCSTLIRLSNSFGEETAKGIVIKTKITNQEMGQMCGTSREVVNRLLRELIQQELITIENKVITIHNIEKLRHMINCEDCHIDVCQVF